MLMGQELRTRAPTKQRSTMVVY